MTDEFQNAVDAAEKLWTDGHELIKATLKLVEADPPKTPPPDTYQRLDEIKEDLVNELSDFRRRIKFNPDKEPPWRWGPRRNQGIGSGDDLKDFARCLGEHPELRIDWEYFDQWERTVRERFAEWRAIAPADTKDTYTAPMEITTIATAYEVHPATVCKWIRGASTPPYRIIRVRRGYARVHVADWQARPVR
jgi:hypothetical protein